MWRTLTLKEQKNIIDVDNLYILIIKMIMLLDLKDVVTHNKNNDHKFFL